MTFSDMAKLLGVSKSDIHNLRTKGLIEGEPGEGVTTAAARPGGTTLRYRRKAMLGSEAKAKQLKVAMDLLRETPSPAGNRPGLLHRAAVALRDGTISLPAERPASPVNDERMPTPKQRKRRCRNYNGESFEVQLFCYVEYRLKPRKRPRVYDAAIKRFGRRAPKNEEGVTIYANRCAEKCRVPSRPPPEEIPALLARAERGELLPVID